VIESSETKQHDRAIPFDCLELLLKAMRLLVVDPLQQRAPRRAGLPAIPGQAMLDRTDPATAGVVRS
jgi:hypothetical protein